MTDSSLRPTEPMDAPRLVQFDWSLPFDVDDVDGQAFMLDRDFAGSMTVPFSKEMDPLVAGEVLLEGRPVDHVLKPLHFGAYTPWILGIRLFGRVTTPGAVCTLRISGFADLEGRVMAPEEITVTAAERGTPDPAFAEHDSVAQRVAEDGIVLLRNEDSTLPLQRGVLPVFGSGLHTFRTSVVGAGKINPRHTVRLREAIRSHAEFTLDEEVATFSAENGDATPDAQLLARSAARAETALVVLTRASGENSDNSSGPGEYRLTDEEDRLLEAVAQHFKKTVLVLNTPYPIDVSCVDRYGIDAVVLAPAGGMLAGPALLRILEGSVNPSGRLPDTWPSDYADLPVSANFHDAVDGRPRLTGNDLVWIDTVYEEGLYVGYRYTSSFGVDVAYPFGAGLSYTTFEVGRADFALGQGGPLDEIAVITGGFHVTNTGTVRGRDAVLVFMSKPDGELEQPAIELVDFGKTGLLGPGESERLPFTLRVEDWASWDDATASYVAPAGEYVIRVGHSVAETESAYRFTVAEDVVVSRRSHLMKPVEPVAVLSRRDPGGSYPRGERSGVKREETSFSPARTLTQPGPGVREPSGTPMPSFRMVIANPGSTEAFVDGLTVDQLARLAVCGQDGWGMDGTGVAGIVAQPEGLDIPLVQVADGNSGVNLRSPNIGMPATVVLASTFDRRLAWLTGRTIAEEARDMKVDVLLAPALNLHRNFLNGRHPEYFSEDPVLTGHLAGAFASGVESTGIGACYKHVAANNAESARKRNQSIIPERALRELYLRAFEIAMRVHPALSVMTGYNAINGAAAAADRELIHGFLRGELGFTGTVMTDWSSYDTVPVVDMMLAGINWVTPGGQDDTYTKPITDAVAAGVLPIHLLRDNVRYLLGTVRELAARRSTREA